MLNPKRSEGYDRIPVCALYDSKEVLLDPLFALFSKIYKTKQIDLTGNQQHGLKIGVQLQWAPYYNHL